jgi:hypothetical protein
MERPRRRGPRRVSEAWGSDGAFDYQAYSIGAGL